MSTWVFQVQRNVQLVTINRVEGSGLLRAIIVNPFWCGFPTAPPIKALAAFDLNDGGRLNPPHDDKPTVRPNPY